MQVATETGAISRAHQHTDTHQAEHIQRFEEIIRIPSIAAENPEAVRECARLVQRWFKELGCKEAEIVETEGSPVVYGHYDAKARNTLLVYFMYDVKQVQGEHWTLIQDPFKPEILPLPPFRKVMVGRGTFNSKGPMTAFLNSLTSIKAAGAEIPVNLKMIAEGEEELGSQHLIDFVKEYEDRLRDGTACFSPATSQNIKGVPSIYLGCKGVVELELECSGEYWRRGPTVRGIHSSLAAIVESPVWRMITALSSMVDQKDPSNVLIEGFYENVALPSQRDLQIVEELAREFDEDALKQTLDVKDFLHNLQGRELLMKALYTTTLNIQGMEAGYTGPKFKTVLPHKVRVKLESRIIPDQTRSEFADKVRKHLDKNGYPDIKVVDASTVKSDDWSRVNPEAGIVNIVKDAYHEHGLKPFIWPFSLGTSPQYLWTKHLKIPFIAAGLGYGARAHAPDEYYVIEGDGEKYKVAGLAKAEKFYVDLVYKMANKKLN